MSVHPSAVVAPTAVVPASCTVGPYCTIGPHVVLGEDCELISHVILDGHSSIGARNKFFPFSSIGVEPQDISYAGQPTRLEMGDENVVRESVTISRGTVKGGGLTRVGSFCLFMTCAHVGHDSQVGDHCIMANAATLAGHVTRRRMDYGWRVFRRAPILFRWQVRIHRRRYHLHAGCTAVFAHRLKARSTSLWH